MADFERYVSILIVDDEVDLSEILVEAVTPVFKEVVACYSGAEALAAVSGRRFSMIVTDLAMPKMNGLEFIEQLRILGIFTPVILLTGAATTTSAILALRLGVADILEKPVPMSMLINSIKVSMDVEERRSQIILRENSPEGNQDALEFAKQHLGLIQVANQKKRAI